jgi:hypothetical protein
MLRELAEYRGGHQYGTQGKRTNSEEKKNIAGDAEREAERPAGEIAARESD